MLNVLPRIRREVNIVFLQKEDVSRELIFESFFLQKLKTKKNAKQKSETAK